MHVNSLVSVQLDRAEYVFLLRVMENLKETTAFLDHQEKRFSGAESTQSMVVGAVIPQIDVSILFPPQAASALQVSCPSFSIRKRNLVHPLCAFQGLDGDSPMADTESIYPDTSSMTDLVQLGRSIQGLKLRSSHSEYVVSQQSIDRPADRDYCKPEMGFPTIGSWNDTETLPHPLVKSQSDRFGIYNCLFALGY